MKIVNSHLHFPKAKLAAPNGYGYIHVAAELERPAGPFPRSTDLKRSVIRQCKAIADRLQKLPHVRNVHVFEAVLIAPGRGKLLNKRKGQVHLAKFDAVVLIETDSLQTAQASAGKFTVSRIDTTLV
ncbi:hypothetical protein [Cohnella luojiensis]|uniref:Uncharacterized protein n=1 Tax=Cohnella luojiensis TaxID=652876 RepID=A0A4Y8M0H0_9BACL|nr:hypothetical protein [Cohnella luojiensis]TFE25230.1 hypothetical protein E2980_14365 [Cohnella luojiensis]